jgi:hypothetical protein
MTKSAVKKTLSGKYAFSENVYFCCFFKDANSEAKEENNEMLFLRAKSKMGLGNIEEAIEFMKTNEKYFTNKLDCQLMTADFLE